jgi:hypothetical protein
MSDSQRPRPQTGTVIAKISAVGVVTLGGGFLMAWLSKILNQSGVFRLEIILPIIAVYGVVSLILTLGVLVSVLAEYGLADPNQAFGLPAGTVRGAIALILLLVFIITSLYVVSVGTTSSSSSVALQQAILATPRVVVAPPVTVITPTLTSGFSEPSPSPTTTPPPTSDRGQGVDKDIAIQLLTTVGTLAVAVSSFYFGSKAAESRSSKG